MSFEQICQRLKSAGISNCEREASLLLEKFCNISPATLPFCRSEDFAEPELLSAVEKRCSHYPLQYILGEWYFYREKYIVNEHCLVPRSDTEILVDLTVNKLPRDSLFADLCTGSGCVAVSVLANRPDTSAFAFDIFCETLDLAKKNAELNGVSDRFYPILADVLKPISIYGNADEKFLDAIISNPPYIKTNEIDCLSIEVSHEPRAALDGGVDGLDFYRIIIEKHSSLVKKGGFIALEIGYDQADDIKTLAANCGFSAEIIKDFGGNDRVALINI